MEVGRTFSRYEISDKLGQGGMGEVFLAHDPSLDRRVALKLLPEELRHDETAKKRFLREARSAAALDHPYICKIYEIGKAEETPFIAMEYVRGETLEQRLARRSVPLAEVVRIASEIAEALETAHRQGIVHRDLKPSNIMLTEDGHVKVMDFGLAKRVTSMEERGELETASRLTGQGVTLGTVAYMSPEQLKAQAVDSRSDIFSFGIVLYEMVAGVHPFRKATSMDTAAATLNQLPPPLSSVRKESPELLEHVVKKMLAKEPGERYQLVHDVRTDLARVEERPGVSRTRTLAAVAVLALLALAGWFLIDALGPRPPPSVAVLPLRNISDDTLETDYLAEGISQAVITRLVQAGLRVTPWDTARRYGHTGEPPEAIARELNTDTVLVGTFHLAGDRILTSLSLVDAKSGLLSWAEEFEAPFEDIFHMQREIAVRAATSLKRSLTGEEEAALITPESRSVDAYDLYLQGAHLTQEGTREATDIAFGYFNQALELDRSLAEAHVGLGVVNYNRYYYGWGGGLDSLDRAEASFRKALELSPTSMRARRGLINVHYQRGHLEACLMEGREAVRLGNPHDVETLLTQATAYQLGGLAEEGAALFREVLEIDPVNQEAQWRLVTSTWLGERELIVEAGRSYLRRFGDDPEIHMFVAFANHLLGHTERARGHYEQAVGLPARGDSTAEATAEPAALFFGGLLYEQLGEPDRATELWQLGVDIYRPRLEESPDNRRFGLILAGFYGLLGDRGSMRAIEERTLGGADWISWEVHWLALVHALRGEPDLAIELLHRALKLGLVDSSRVPAWEVYFRVADVPMPENEAFTRFVGEYRAEARRLRETY